MSESTLSVTFAEIKAEVGEFLGLGRAPSSWSTEHSTRVEAAIKAGLRQFYFPPRTPTNSVPHKWSFLRPLATLALSAPYSEGTVVLTNGSTAVSGIGTTFPSWVPFGELVINGASYGIASAGVDSLVLDFPWAGATSAPAGQSYLIERSVYDLPDSFGSIDDEFVYAENQGGSISTIPIVGEARIRALRVERGSRGRPRCAGIRPKASTGTAGQRWEVLFHPSPDGPYVLSYRYKILPDHLVATTNEYPLGGAAHGQTIIASCLAAADSRFNDQPRGGKYAEFMDLLEASIAADLDSVPKFLGRNEDRARWAGSRHGADVATFNGVLYDGNP